MNPTLLFLLCTILAFVLFAAEVFVPGGVLAVIGGFSLLAACGFAIAAFGPATGLIVALLLIVVTLIGFIFWLSIMPDTRVGKRFALSHSLKDEAASTENPLVGKTGTAMTDLRPGGFALLEGRKTDVVARRGYLEKGTPVEVVEVHGSRVVVRKAEESTT